MLRGLVLLLQFMRLLVGGMVDACTISQGVILLLDHHGRMSVLMLFHSNVTGWYVRGLINLLLTSEGELGIFQSLWCQFAIAVVAHETSTVLKLLMRGHSSRRSTIHAQHLLLLLHRVLMLLVLHHGVLNKAMLLTVTDAVTGEAAHRLLL